MQAENTTCLLSEIQNHISKIQNKRPSLQSNNYFTPKIQKK
jgi:hypothetical protein